MSSKDKKPMTSPELTDAAKRVLEEENVIRSKHEEKLEADRKARISILTKNGFSEEDAAGFVK